MWEQIMEMQVTELENGIKEIVLSGRLDMEGSGQIDNAFALNVTKAKALVLVDLSQVDFIASIGMRLLVMNGKELARRGGHLVLFNPQPLVAEALLLAGIDAVIPMFTERDAAEAELRSVVQ
jgi:anti-sigma B factor antagonist